MAFKKIDSPCWNESRLAVRVQIAIITFVILALELALIRWTSSQIRIFAYFNNIVLISAFLGMGLGVAWGRRFPGLIKFALPTLVVLSLPLGFSEQLGLVSMPFPDESISLWGAEIHDGNFERWMNLGLFLLLLFILIAVFVFISSPLGYLFSRIETLNAYGADLFGSLVGILAFTLLTFLGASPPLWLAISLLPLLLFVRLVIAAPCAIVIILLGFHSIQGAYFSPYNRIDLSEQKYNWELQVNRDFHQYMHDFSDDNLEDMKQRSEEDESLRPVYMGMRAFRHIYNMPYAAANNRDRALIVGGGSGNDAMAALRMGFDTVYSVDIDPKIVALGKAHHPEEPLNDPRVNVVINDARAFFEQYDGEPFDVVAYGLLDSHAMFSAMSSLRLDNFVYTEEGIGSAWSHVNDGGFLALTMSAYAGDWFIERLYWTIRDATGVPVRVFLHRSHGQSITYLTAKPGVKLDESYLANFREVTDLLDPDEPMPAYVQKTSDDWPFLYIKPGSQPVGYAIVLSFIFVVALVGVRYAYGKNAIVSGFDPALFFMGAAFLLIETRGVTSLSLLFGSTWLVNSSVFAGILVMVLLANLFVSARPPLDLRPWYVGLFLATLMLYIVDVGMLNQFPMLVRGILGGLLTGLPIGFAGIIVSSLLKRSSAPAASLGSNLIGSVLGGCIEYSSMLMGLKALALLALVFYLLAYLSASRAKHLLHSLPVSA